MPTAGTATEVFLGSAIPNNLAPPSPPKAIFANLVVAGALSARTERIIVTLVNANGEGPNSPELVVAVPANYVVLITAPGHIEGTGTGQGVTGWNCYMTTGASLSETKQNTALLAISSSFQEPNSGLIGGAALPNIAPTYPGLIDGNNNIANTPPSTGALTPPQSPLNTPTTNTGRTLEATASYMANLLNILNVGTTPPPAKN